MDGERLSSDLAASSTPSLQIHDTGEGELIDIDESESDSDSDSDIQKAAADVTPRPEPDFAPRLLSGTLSLSTDSLLSISSPSSPASPTPSLLSISDLASDLSSGSEAPWGSDSHSELHEHTQGLPSQQAEGEGEGERQGHPPRLLQEHSFSTVATDGSLPLSFPQSISDRGSRWPGVDGWEQRTGKREKPDGEADGDDACSFLSMSSASTCSQ